MINIFILLLHIYFNLIFNNFPNSIILVIYLILKLVYIISNFHFLFVIIIISTIIALRVVLTI